MLNISSETSFNIFSTRTKSFNAIAPKIIGEHLPSFSGKFALDTGYEKFDAGHRMLVKCRYLVISLNHWEAVSSPTQEMI